MATESISSVKTGGDYTSLVSWEAAEETDLQVADEIAVAEVSGTITDTSFLGFGSGWNSDATRNIIIRAEAGSEVDFSDLSGAQYANTQGFAIRPGAEYVHIETIFINHPYSGSTFYLPSGADHLTLNRVCVYQTGASPCISAGDRTVVAQNCFLWQNSGSSHAAGYGIGLTLRNCVCVTDNAYGIAAYDGYSYNTVGFQTHGSPSFNCFFSPDGGDYNASNDTSSPGANSVDNITTSDFVDAANDDWHIDTDSACYEAGDDLSAYYTEDADGDTWGSTYSIGFDEPAASGVNYAETFVATSAADLVLTDAWALDYTETFVATSAADLALADTWALDYTETFVATSAADLALADTWALNYTETYATTSAADLALADTWTLDYTETFTATSTADLALTDAYNSPSVAYDETFAATSVADLSLIDSWSLDYTETFTATSTADLALADAWTLDYAESFAATSVGDLTLADSYAVGANYVESFAAISVADLALTDSWALNYTETFVAASVADLALTEVWAYGYTETFAAAAVADLALTHTYGFQYEETFTATSVADLALTDSWAVGYVEAFAADALADLDLTHSFITPSAIGRIINPTLKESCDSRTVRSSKLIN